MYLTDVQVYSHRSCFELNSQLEVTVMPSQFIRRCCLVLLDASLEA